MRYLLLSSIIIFALSSCETAEFIQHTPTLANTGQHTGKDQLHGRLLYSTGSSTSNSGSNTLNTDPYESVNGVQAQASYSISGKLALQSSFMHSAEKGGNDNSGQTVVVYNHKRTVTEAGLAFFDNLGNDNSFFIELAAGTGFGKFNSKEANSAIAPGGRFYDHNVFKLYAQPSVYYSSPSFCVNMGLKFSSINFSNISTNYTDLERSNRSINTGSSLHTTTLDFFMKADAYLKQLPWLGFNAQFLYSSDLQKKFNYNQTDWNAGFGLSFRLDGLSKKK